MTGLASLFAFGQLQVSWIYFCLLALLALDFYFLGRGLLTVTPTPPQNGPWAQPGPSPARLRASVWVSLAIALAYGAALVLRTPLAFWLAIGYLGPALYRYVLTIPFAATPRDIGSTTGSLIGTAVQVLLMLAGIASLDPLSGFPLRLASHLSGAAP